MCCLHPASQQKTEMFWVFRNLRLIVTFLPIRWWNHQMAQNMSSTITEQPRNESWETTTHTWSLQIMASIDESSTEDLIIVCIDDKRLRRGWSELQRKNGRNWRPWVDIIWTGQACIVWKALWWLWRHFRVQPTFCVLLHLNTFTVCKMYVCAYRECDVPMWRECYVWTLHESVLVVMCRMSCGNCV